MQGLATFIGRFENDCEKSKKECEQTLRGGWVSHNPTKKTDDSFLETEHNGREHLFYLDTL
jgi:hypothetical protein